MGKLTIYIQVRRVGSGSVLHASGKHMFCCAAMAKTDIKRW